MTPSPAVSIIITVFNEEQNIAPLIRKISDSLGTLDYEVILVDDGSTDDTIDEIRAAADDRIKIIELGSNFGQTAAMSAGIDRATGLLIVTMDGDLQNDPEDIPAMVEKLNEQDWDLVAGKRVKRKDGFFLRKIPSKIANGIIRLFTGVMVSDYGCSLKVMKSDIAKNLGLYGELHRFIPVLVQLQGGRITNMDVKHHPRIHGTSKYGLGRTFRVFSDLILMVFFQKYARRPMHLFGTLGILTFGSGAIINTYLLVEKIMGNDIWGRPLLILGITLVLAGIQFFTFGIIAEIMMRTYLESGHKKIYRIKSIHGFSEEQAN